MISGLLRARFIYLEAMRQLDARHPIGVGLAVSLLQDAVEVMCWHVSAEVGAQAKMHTNFPEYWDLVAQKSPNKQLPYKAQMLRLNDARTAFKHKGMNLTDGDCQAHAVNAHRFLQDCCSTFFSADFDSLSECDLLKEGPLRAALVAANEAHALGDYETAINRCTDARYIIDDELRKAVPLTDDFRISWPFGGSSDPVVKIGQALEKRVDALAAAVRVVSLGLLPTEHLLLRRILPARSVSGTNYFHAYQFRWQMPGAETSNAARRILMRAALALESTAGALASSLSPVVLGNTQEQSRKQGEPPADKKSDQGESTQGPAE